MSIAVILLAAGLLSGLARGGKLENISRVEFRLPWLVFIGLGIQVTAELVAAFVYPPLRNSGRGILILGISYACLIVFMSLNRHLPGWALVAGGLALNLLVISLNGGMPVSNRAAQAAGFDASDYLETAVKHRPLSDDTLLPFLGDIIPLPFIEKVVSAGDLFIGLGLFWMIERLVRYEPKRVRA